MIVDRFLGDRMRVPARRFAESLAIDTAAFKAYALKITPITLDENLQMTEAA